MRAVIASLLRLWVSSGMWPYSCRPRRDLVFLCVLPGRRAIAADLLCHGAVQRSVVLCSSTGTSPFSCSYQA
eukprot:9145001-Pyramimonas_sp.AAC.1